MLYALASTGSLSRGTIRPYDRCECARDPRSEGCHECGGTFRIVVTDDEWIERLASKLEAEAEHAIEECGKRIEAEDDEDGDLHADLGGLMSIVETIQIWRASRAKR